MGLRLLALSPNSDTVAHMQRSEKAPKDLLREARQRAALSASALAGRAGVATSTVTRIESGDVDPTFTMLAKLLDAAGERLMVESQPAAGAVELARLRDAWRRTNEGDLPDWTRLRGLLASLQERPELLPAAIHRPPAKSGSEVLDALLAGIADKLADDHELPRPTWTKTRRLKKAWSPPGTPRQKAHRERHTPPQLREHNVLVDAETLWRGASVDA